MNIKQYIRQSLLVLATALTVVSCGGGGGSVAGIGGTGITASGTITGFGSIFVNGIRFDTGSASITVDDSVGSENDLGLGMVVTVSGTVDAGGTTGTATTVAFDDELQGQIQTVPVDPVGDGTRLRFAVLGVTVEVDSVTTVFDDGVSFGTLAQGDFVEVSGFVDPAGFLQATRIEGKGVFTPGVSEVELKGAATGVSGVTFTLGTFTVNTAGADLSGVPGGVVTEGMQVEVKGTLTGSTITATRVKLNDDLFGNNVAKVSVEGIVSAFAGNNSFQVAGQQVDASGATFVPLSLVLANGVEVEVEGPVVNGVLQAIRVEARGGNVELEAVVQSVSSGAGTITLQYATGSVTVLVDSQTSLRDDLDVFDPYEIGDIVATDFLEVRAALNGNGDIVATEIRRDSQDDDILQGPATACDGSSVTIFGVGFTLLDGTTVYENEFDQQVYAGGAAFCTDVQNRGLFVKVKDEVTANGTANEAELEN